MNSLENLFSKALGGLSAPSAEAFIKNLGEHIPMFESLLGAFAYLSAFIFVIVGVIQLKKAGMRDDANESPAKAIIIIFLGVALAYLNTTIFSVGATMLGPEHTYGFAYTTNPNLTDGLNGSLKVIFRFISLIGIMAVIHGIYVFRQTTEGVRDASIAKGMWHLVGGVIAMNLDAFIQVLKISTGFA